MINRKRIKNVRNRRKLQMRTAREQLYSEKKSLCKLANTYIGKLGVIESSSKLFQIYSPWVDKNVDLLIENFFKSLKNDSTTFSWLNIEGNLPNSTEKSIRYGIPNHIRGNIDEATLFLCLVNPNIAKVKTNRSSGILTYYKNARELETKDDSLKIIDSDENLLKDDQYLKKHIVDVEDTSSILYNELKIVRKSKLKENGYYLSHYLPHFLMESLDKKGSLKKLIQTLDVDEWEYLEIISKKIANIEAFPFRSQNPNYISGPRGEGNFTNQLVNSDSKVSLLSARIIIWRVVNHILTSKNKPIFIFRRFNTFWLPSLSKVLKYDLGLTSEEIDNILYDLHEDYFITVRKKEYNGQSGYFGRNFCKNNLRLSDNEFKDLVETTLGKYQKDNNL